MGRDCSKSPAELLEKIRDLPPAMQYAVLWAANHFEACEEMSKNSRMTLAEVEKELESAKNAQQYGLLILLLLCREEIQKKGGNTEKLY